MIPQKPTELDTLDGRVLWYVISILIKNEREKKRLSWWPSFWCLFKFCTHRPPHNFPSFLILVPPGQAKSFWISLISVSSGGQALFSAGQTISCLHQEIPPHPSKLTLLVWSQSDLHYPHPPSPFPLDHTSCPNPRLWEQLEYLGIAVQSLSRVWLSSTPWSEARQASLWPSVWVCSNSWPLSQWCHPANSSSVVPFSSCLQSFPASVSFPTSQFFKAAIGASASASFLPMNSQGWFPLVLTDLILPPRDSQESSPTPQFKSILE